MSWHYVMASIAQSSQDYHESVSYYFMWHTFLPKSFCISINYGGVVNYTNTFCSCCSGVVNLHRRIVDQPDNNKASYTKY